MSAIIKLKNYLARIDDYDRARDLASWDQQVNMPSRGSAGRAHQMTALSEHIHALGTSKELGRLIAAAEAVDHEDKVSRALVRQARRDYDLETKLPAKLVSEFAQATSRAHDIWEQAKSQSNFAIFAPALEKIVVLTRQISESYGYEHHPYDPLLDQYEQGMTVARVGVLFDQLREGIAPLVRQIAATNNVNSRSLLRGNFDTGTQVELAKRFAQIVGFDFTRGRLDVATHPFCTNLGIDDIRLTTRVRPSEYWDCISSTLHETGHGLYEQGVDRRLSRTPLGGGVSLGVHESQSRLWENLVGGSLPFWQKHLSVIQEMFPDTAGISPDEFYRAINSVSPTFIRTEADEVTYNLHVIIRFELEKALLEGDLKVADLPAAWNHKYQEYLGITPPDDAQGVLQDVHWSAGLFGYFPTYTIGNVLSVQLYNAALSQTEGLVDQLLEANYAGLHEWLQDHVYTHGGVYIPEELIQRTTGSGLDAAPYLAYLQAKYTSLYQLK